MFLSIIIATFNSSKNISKCLSSIINQNFLDYEIIIKDNNSSDDTITIIKKIFNEKKINNYQVIVSEDKSVYEAWNIALEKTSGDYIMFLGSDDFLKKDSLSYYYNYIIHNDSPSYVYCKADKINSNNLKIKTIGEQFYDYKFKKHMSVVHTGSLHKKKLFDKYGKFDLSFKIAGDYEFLLRFYKKEKFHFIDKILLNSLIGGLSEYSFTTQIEGFKAKHKHYTDPLILIYIDTIIIIFKVLIKKIFNILNVSY